MVARDEFEFEVKIPAGLSGRAADDAAVEAFADQVEQMTDAKIAKMLGF